MPQPTRGTEETEDIESPAVSVSALIDTLVQLFPIKFEVAVFFDGWSMKWLDPLPRLDKPSLKSYALQEVPT